MAQKFSEMDMFSHYYPAAFKDKYCGFGALTLAAFLVASCAAGSRNPPLRIPDYQAESDAVARFSAPAQGNKPGQATGRIVSEAAAITLQHKYKYFLLVPIISDNEKHGASLRPHLGISYGRQPYGFGDADSSGFGPSLSFSVTPSFPFRNETKTGKTEWAIYMMRQASRQALDALPLDKAILGKTAYIYNAREAAHRENSEPIILPLH